jgi:undecaprenyl-phosphate 4-deoxy-4-formamido-L-arabinose transferase
MLPDLSIVIPLYRSEEGLPALFQALAALSIPEVFEVVFVNDGSPDRTADRCRELLPGAPFTASLVDLTRNFGEHNAVLAGYRQARGRWVVTIDDDLQNPPDEAVRLFRFTRERGFDVVYSYYSTKQHARWRNLGSRLANAVADLLLEKPHGLYLSSFRCVTAAVAREVCKYDGPYVYIDGLITQVTQRIGSLEVRHEARHVGRSTYDVQKLVRLWLNILFNFSIVPLRMAILLGLVTAVAGLSLLVQVIVERLTSGTPLGWGSLMAAIIVFAGVQLIVLGGVGEYVGRLFLTANRRPQSVVREVVLHDPTRIDAGRSTDVAGRCKA